MSLNKILFCAFVSVAGFSADLISADKTKVFTSVNQKGLPSDYAFQGEYVGKTSSGKPLGCQVISLGQGAFHAVLYPGGLPGAGWDGQNKSLMTGFTDGDQVSFNASKGSLKYVSKDPKAFSATKVFPPKGHTKNEGTIQASAFKGNQLKGETWSLQKTLRKSPTLGKSAPENATVLFDGEDKDHFTGGRLDPKTKLLNTDGKDIRTVKKYSNYSIHLEFMLPYRPDARGQGRGNSGVYHVDKYETQVLDSFGLMGETNECGGIYKKKTSDVNMCLPPLTWQTYDVDFESAVVKDGVKVKNARITARLNGVVIHDKFEINGPTGGAKGKEGEPGHIRLQGHGNPLQYRNIWIIEK